jgi:8-oxo-dGTP pyrophosphatase MutT (NUDIX family)
MSKLQSLEHPLHFQRLKNQLSLEKAYWKPDIIKSWAAVHLVFAHDQNALDTGLKLAMIKRTEKPDDPWSGHYAFPGGRAEKGEDLLTTSRRETLEEVGLSLTDEVYLGEFFHLQLFYKGEPLPYAISAHASYLPAPQSFTACPDEVAEAFWFNISDLHNSAHVNHRPFKMSQGQRVFPCLQFDGHTVWGISYLILREIFRQYDGLPFHREKSFSKELLPAYPYGNALDEK